MRVVVVGGGISGLAAAHRLAGAGVEVVVVERAERAGGKLRTVELAGEPVEAGAEAFLLRDPSGGPSAALELARAVGLGDALVHPATGAAAVHLSGALRPMPARTVLGVPTDLSTLDGLARPADRDRDGGRPLLGPDRDVAVGALVRARLGDEVADRLVDPLLGGVYAGRADDLSLATTLPALARAARREHTLVAAARAALAERATVPGEPVFATVPGGIGRLVDALLAATDAELRLGLPVRRLVRSAGRWRVLLGAAPRPATLDADAVVLAVPARPAARLLSDVDSTAAAAVGVLDYGSVALVTLVLPEVELPALSGFLVPATEGYAVKAATFVDRKWAHWRRPGRTLVRVSIGRYGEESTLQRSDEELVALAHAELSVLLGPVGSGRDRLPAPLASRVDRWGGGLPQYPVGHLDRVAAARRALPPQLALAGAGYDGVGIAACVRSGLDAAEAVLRSASC